MKFGQYSVFATMEAELGTWQLGPSIFYAMEREGSFALLPDIPQPLPHRGG